MGTNGANLVFLPGTNGFARSVISVPNNVAFETSTSETGPIVISVPRGAPVWRAKQRVESVLIDAPRGINTNAVRLAGLRRTTAEFEFLPTDADRPTSLVFRYGPRGLALILK